MKERPIIFSTPMVKAILAGRKTQTRRILKPQPVPCLMWGDPPPGTYPSDKGWSRFPCAPGDRLWVRETWGHTGHGVWKVSDARMASLNGKVVYRADDDTPGGWFPSIHMPREFARIFLKVTNVRVERLQDISEEDAKAEGVRLMRDDSGTYVGCEGPERYVTPWPTAKEAFSDIWESINGAGSWSKNPWVYALTFERVEALEKAA